MSDLPNSVNTYDDSLEPAKNDLERIIKHGQRRQQVSWTIFIFTSKVVAKLQYKLKLKLN